MHTFIVVCARPRRQVPEHVQRLLHSAAPAELTFPPDEHIHWADDTAGLHFAGWQAGAAHLGLGSHWEVRPDGVVAFSGHTWVDTEPWKPGPSWASQLADRLADVDAATLARRMDGVFNLIDLRSDGTGTVTGDPLGIGLTYIGHSDDVTVLSNRAALVARLIAPAGHSPARDAEGTVQLAYANNLQTDRTTFVGVSPLPRASAARLSPGTDVSVERWAHLPWIDTDLTDSDPTSPELFLPAVMHMRSLVRVMTELPNRQRTLELTGGRDSRMILALLIAEEVAEHYAYVTWGSPELPDVVVAGELADRFDLDLRAQGRPRVYRPRPSRPQDPPLPASRRGATVEDVAPDVTDLDHEAVIRRHVWRTSGAVSIWDLSRHLRVPSPNVALTGQFGELIRTNYPRTTGIGSRADLESFVRTGGFGFDAAGLFRRSARDHHDDQVLALLDDLWPVDGTALDAIDGFNQVTRLRRWFGASNELDNRNRMFPLYSMPATQVAFAIGSHLRRLEVVPFEVIRATCPDLATMGFAPSAWPESLIRSRPDAERYPTSPDVAPWAPPSPAPGRSGLGRLRPRPKRRSQAAPKLTAEQGTMRNIESKIPVYRDMVDLGPGHELYRYLDYDATIAAVNDLAELPFLARRSVHDAITAAMWLGGADVPETF